MQQHDRKRAVEQQHDLARELLGLTDSSGFEAAAQPALEFPLVGCADFDRGMAGHVGEFGRGPQKTAALPFRMPRRARQIAEDAFHLGRQSALGLVEPLLEQRQVGLVARGEISGDQIVLAAEVIIQRALGDPGLGRHRVDADTADALAVEQFAGGRDDPIGGRYDRCAHGPNVYRPVNIHNGWPRLRSPQPLKQGDPGHVRPRAARHRR